MIDTLIQELINLISQKKNINETIKKIDELNQDDAQLAATIFCNKFISLFPHIQKKGVKEKIDAIWPYFVIFSYNFFRSKISEAFKSILTWVITTETGSAGNILNETLECLNSHYRSFFWINAIHDIAAKMFIKTLFPHGFSQGEPVQIETNPPINELDSIITFFKERGLNDNQLQNALNEWNRLKAGKAKDTNKTANRKPESLLTRTNKIPAPTKDVIVEAAAITHTGAATNNTIDKLKNFTFQGLNFKKELFNFYNICSTIQQHDPNFIKQAKATLLQYFDSALRDLQHRLAFNTNNHPKTDQTPSFIVTKIGFFKLIKNPGRPTTAAAIAEIWYEFIRNKRSNILKLIDHISKAIDHKHQGGFWRDDTTAKYYGDLLEQLELVKIIALFINQPAAPHHQKSFNIS